MKKLKTIPKFKSEEEEREFWLNHDSTEYLDWSKARVTVFPNLKPSITDKDQIDLKNIRKVHK